MSKLFTPAGIATLDLPNRLIRSATAESMADAEGRPGPALQTLYTQLARGGVGLIITGHMYVHPSGKAHSMMTGIYADGLIPDLAELAQAVHRQAGKIVVQINHGGMQCWAGLDTQPIAPSAVPATTSHPGARPSHRPIDPGHLRGRPSLTSEAVPVQSPQHQFTVRRALSNLRIEGHP